MTIEQFKSGHAVDRIAEIRAVLRLVLEDLDDGIAGIGAGVARGYGSVYIDLADAEQRGDLPDGQTARQILRQMVDASRTTAPSADRHATEPADTGSESR